MKIANDLIKHKTDFNILDCRNGKFFIRWNTSLKFETIGRRQLKKYIKNFSYSSKFYPEI